jgi:hypothetical protein
MFLKGRVCDMTTFKIIARRILKVWFINLSKLSNQVKRKTNCGIIFQSDNMSRNFKEVKRQTEWWEWLIRIRIRRFLLILTRIGDPQLRSLREPAVRPMALVYRLTKVISVLQLCIQRSDLISLSKHLCSSGTYINI